MNVFFVIIFVKTSHGEKQPNSGAQYMQSNQSVWHDTMTSLLQT